MISFNTFANNFPSKSSDAQIEKHLEKIFSTTQWFPELEVEVTEGLVILSGQVNSLERKQWALDIINKTDGTVGVIDKLELNVPEGQILEPAQMEVIKIYENISKLLPYIASALILLFFFVIIAISSKNLTSSILRKRKNNPLLIKAVANIVGALFIILGFYFAFKTSGLSGLAVTLLGGTGIISIGIGFALKNTFENYFSGIMISTKELLKIGEIVNINGYEGVVQTVTTRGTSLMDYDGNNIVIPNSEVLNSVIQNFSRNPKMRTNFNVGIGYEDNIDIAFEVIHRTLKELSPSILIDPEPIAAVDTLGSATVNLKVYFWFDVIQISRVKIRSLVIKNIKEALMQANISMPDDAREVVFASPLKIQQVNENQIVAETVQKSANQREVQSHLENSKIDLDNEVKEIQKQSQTTPTAETGENIL